MAGFTTHTGTSRGELGFLVNNLRARHNLTYLGSTGNPSKKGVAALNGYASRMGSNGGTERSANPITEGSMVTKRTEWLESQEKKLTATVAHSRTEQQLLQEQLAISAGQIDSVTRETKRLTAEAEKTNARTRQLFLDNQWVYGKTSCNLLGVDGGEGIARALKKYREDVMGEAVDLIQVAASGKIVLLSYPMERVDTVAGHQLLMKVKSVDKRTGQLSYHWAIVYEQHGSKVTRPISEFSTTPL